MKKSIFEYLSYRAYLNDFILSQPQKGWGMQAKFAKHLGCHTTFISQVLKGQLELNAEQAISLCEYTGLTESETEFFLLLVNHNRSGSQKLKSFLKKQIDQKVKSNYQLNKRIEIDRSLTNEELSVYYSSWEYAAIDVVSSLPNLHTPDAIAKFLNIPKFRVAEVLEYLISVGLIKREHGKLISGNSRIHVGDDSRKDLIAHHTNWRLRAIQAIQKIHPNYKAQRLNWSAVISLSKKDVHLVREELFQTIQRLRKIVRDSKEETAYSYTIDLFPIGANDEDAPQIEDIVNN